jgi:ligand-binding sensor domain-containing protein
MQCFFTFISGLEFIAIRKKISTGEDYIITTAMKNLGVLPKKNFFLSKLHTPYFPFANCLIAGVVTLSFMLIGASGAHGQIVPQPVSRHITVDEGLSASEVYHVYQDSRGYIWFATNNGVSRFNGYEFENFDMVSGLPDNTVFEIYEDFKHRIWFIPFSGSLSYYENGSIKNYSYNSKIVEHLPNSRGPNKLSFYVDSLDNVSFGLKDFGIISIDQEGIYKHMDDSNTDAQVVARSVGGGKILVSDPHELRKYGLFYFDGRQSYRFTFSELGIKPFKPIYFYAQQAKDGSAFITIDGNIYRIRNGKVVSRNHSITQSIIWMSIDADNNLWVSAFEGGVYMFPNCDLESSERLCFLKDYQVTSVLRDDEGSYWFSTLNDGVFYIPDHQIAVFSKENGLSDNRVNAVYARDGKIYVGFEMGFVDVIANGQITHYKISSNEKAGITYVRDIYGDTLTGRVLVAAFGHIAYFENNKLKKLIPDSFNLNTRRIIGSKDGGYWLATAKGFYKIENNHIAYDSRSDGFSGMVFSLAEDNRGTLWFSTVNGLWRYFDSTLLFMGSENQLLAKVSHSMFFSHRDSSLWIGTNGAGIVIYGKDGKVSQISAADGLVSNSIHYLFPEGSRIWVATRQGLSILTLTGDTTYNIQNLTVLDGLPSNEVTSVFVRDGVVYIGTNKGLATLNYNDLAFNHTPPKVEITGVFVDGHPTPIANGAVQLNYSSNAVNFSYIGLAYRNMGNILYKYRLMGLDSAWLYTRSTSCIFSSLNSGNYTFQVQAQNSNGIWSSSVATLNLIIKPPFWERFWFIILATLILAGTLYAVYSLRISEIKRRNELINSINLYKQQSLRQQMNPHFIFNTLNSIQYFILERDTVSSHKYLTKFARLMRLTLDNSLSPTVSLRDELDALRLYLDLEALRLEGKFTYSIDYSDNESILSAKIPTLMIQPFVENAIWHGIMLKKEKSGHVWVKIVDEGDWVVCTIQDDGVGRAEAQRIQERSGKEYSSRGFQITRQRIELLNTLYGEKFSIKFIDLFDDMGNASGTLVSISIPKNLDVV